MNGDPRRRDDLPRDAAARSSTARREPVEAKGKAEPVPVWEALEARVALRRRRRRRPATPLVGRERELDLLLDALARAREERAPQLVTLVGVPGIGKSRLVYELFARRRRRPGAHLPGARAARLPYGDGVTYWALGEMVKAQAGILETDSAEEARARSSAESVAERWTARRRGVGRGTSGRSSGSAGRRSSAATAAEAFAAWRRFFEALAEQRPLVLVFEDLHWADDGLLDFVDHLVDWATGVPLLVVCTARPSCSSGGRAGAAGSRTR